MSFWYKNESSKSCFNHEHYEIIIVRVTSSCFKPLCLWSSVTVLPLLEFWVATVLKIIFPSVVTFDISDNLKIVWMSRITLQKFFSFWFYYMKSEPPILWLSDVN